MNSIPTGTASETRVWARKIVDRIITENVLGPVACLPHADVLQLRQILREEFRAALGYPYKRKPKMRRRYQIQERDILPSMRDWARRKGLIKPEFHSTP